MLLLVYSVPIISIQLLLFSSTLAANILGLFTHGHRSHLLLYSNIVQILLARGHNVTVVSLTPLEHLPKNITNLRQIQLTIDIEKSNDSTDIDEHATLLGVSFQRIERNAMFMSTMKWKRFLADNNTHYDLMLLGYMFNEYLLGVAVRFECSAIVIWPGPPISYLHTMLGNPEMRWHIPPPYDTKQRTGISAVIPSIFEKVVEHISLQVMAKIYKQYFPTNVVYPTFWQMRQNVSLVMCNHYSISDGPIAPYLPTLIEIGGIQNYQANQRLRNKIDQTLATYDNDLIFLSFGTRIKWSYLPINLTSIFIEAFNALPQFTVLWTFDGDCTNLSTSIGNIQCKKWWPQAKILRHPKLRLFITHGGKGSLSEATHYGVPILGIPFIGDQYANIEKLTKRGVGLQMKSNELNTAHLIESIRLLTQPNSTYVRQARALAARYRDRPMTPDKTMLYWLEYVIRYKGAAHLKYAGNELNWLQAYSIDIYIVIAISYVSIVCALNWLERILIRLNAI